MSAPMGSEVVGAAASPCRCSPQQLGFSASLAVIGVRSVRCSLRGPEASSSVCWVSGTRCSLEKKQGILSQEIVPRVFKDCDLEVIGAVACLSVRNLCLLTFFSW